MHEGRSSNKVEMKNNLSLSVAHNSAPATNTHSPTVPARAIFSMKRFSFEDVICSWRSAEEGCGSIQTPRSEFRVGIIQPCRRSLSDLGLCHTSSAYVGDEEPNRSKMTRFCICIGRR